MPIFTNLKAVNTILIVSKCNLDGRLSTVTQDSILRMALASTECLTEHLSDLRLTCADFFLFFFSCFTGKHADIKNVLYTSCVFYLGEAVFYCRYTKRDLNVSGHPSGAHTAPLFGVCGHCCSYACCCDFLPGPGPGPGLGCDGTDTGSQSVQEGGWGGG